MAEKILPGCHKDCPMDRYCRMLRNNPYYGSNELKPDDCWAYYKCEDLLMEARDNAARERYEREHALDEDDIPFSDDEDFTEEDFEE